MDRQSLYEREGIIKKLRLTEERPTFFKILVIAGILTASFNTFLTGRGTFSDFIAMAVGSIIGLIIITVLLGIIPFFILRNKIKMPRMTIFGVIFLLVCIASIIGTLYGAGYINALR